MRNKIKNYLVETLVSSELHRDSLAAQWFRLHPSNAGSVGLIPGWVTVILHATWYSQKLGKQKQDRTLTRSQSQKPNLKE